ncbi:MAG: DUF2812 domain-containing protein [Lachnospiraceae bacterium]|nr:DUF2812 domain-containing protein [Lachnospiraceae bacterium]
MKKTSHAIAYDNLGATKAYLESMAKEGWMLEKISGNTQFIFRECEPADVRFAVEIFVDGSMFDTYTIDSNLEFIEYCKKAGWDFICSSGKIDIFCTEDPDVPEIESDERMKLQTIKKACRPMRVLYPIIISVLGGISLGYSLTVNLNLTESSILHFSTLMLWLFVETLTLANLIAYLGWVVKANACVNAGGRIPERKIAGYKGNMIFLLIVALLHSVAAVILGVVWNEKVMFVIPAIWAVMFLVLFVTGRVTAFAEKRKMGRAGFGLLILVVIPVCCVMLLTNLIIYVVLGLDESNSSGKKIDAGKLEAFGSSEDITRREDHLTHWGHFLVGIDQYTVEAYNADGEKQLEAERNGNGHYRAPDGEDFVPVSYTWSFDIYDTKIAAIHERLLREAGEGKNLRMLGILFPYSEAEEVAALESGNIKVYHYEKTYPEDGTTAQLYLICNDRVIVRASCDEALDQAQMSVIRESFLD